MRLHEGLKTAGLNVWLNGHPEKKLPNTWNITFEGFTSAKVMDALGRDIAVSPGAACHGDTVNASHVLVAMGVPKELSRGAVRFSFGRETTEEHVDQVVEILKRELRNAR